MLWLNLIMDSLASLALATEQPTDSMLDLPPYSSRQSLLTPTVRPCCSLPLFLPPHHACTHLPCMCTTLQCAPPLVHSAALCFTVSVCWMLVLSLSGSHNVLLDTHDSHGPVWCCSAWPVANATSHVCIKSLVCTQADRQAILPIFCMDYFAVCHADVTPNKRPNCQLTLC